MALTEQIQPPSFSVRGPVRAARALLTLNSTLPFPVLLYFIAIALPVQFNAGGVLLTGVRCLLLAMFVPIVFKLLAGHYGKLIWADLIFFLFCPWAIWTLYLNSPASAISFGGSVAVEFYGGYLLARAYIRTPETFAGMCKALFWVIALTLPFAFYETQTGWAPIPGTLNKLPFFFSYIDFYNEAAGKRMGLERAAVNFQHPIHYGLFCSTAFSLAFVGFKGLVTTWQRYMIALLSILGVIFSVSSGAMLPMILHFVLIFWAWSLDKVRSKWIIIMILVAFAYVIVDLISNRTPIQVFLSYATFSPHNAYWRVLIFEWGLKNVWANPLYGLGLNEWVRPWFMNSGSMDNFWLLNAVRYGIPGFLLMATGYVLIIWGVARRKIEEGTPTWQFRRAWMITFVGLVLSLCTVDVWASVFSYVSFLLGSGVWFLSAAEKLPKTGVSARLAAGRSSAAPSAMADDLQDLTRATAERAPATSGYTRFDQTQIRRKSP